MSKNKELVCDNRYTTHDWLKGPKYWLCLCCGKKRASRERLTENELSFWRAYWAYKNAPKTQEVDPDDIPAAEALPLESDEDAPIQCLGTFR